MKLLKSWLYNRSNKKAASISEEIANQTITLNSAGKTFNIAGLNTSYAISKNEELLNRFKKKYYFRKSIWFLLKK